MPAFASEIFSLNSFDALRDFLTLASPSGSLIFSGVIAIGICNFYADKQATLNRKTSRFMLCISSERRLSCSGNMCALSPLAYC